MAALDFIFPGTCRTCQQPISDGKGVCDRCAGALRQIEAPFCQVCGIGFSGQGLKDFSCPNCLKETYDFAFARGFLRGNTEAIHLAYLLKFQRDIELGRLLGRICAQLIENDIRYRSELNEPVLVPVPLHWKRERGRHFNQAYEIARVASRLTGLPLVEGLKRVLNTNPQSKLGRNQRLKNLQTAFQVQKKSHAALEGRHVIIIDDVLTTCATVQACATTLRRGAEVKTIAVACPIRAGR